MPKNPEVIEQATDAPGETRAITPPVWEVVEARGVEHGCTPPDGRPGDTWTCTECLTTWQR